MAGSDVTGVRIGRQIYDMPVLADGMVRFIGEKVAAVAADSRGDRRAGIGTNRGRV